MEADHELLVSEKKSGRKSVLGTSHNLKQPQVETFLVNKIPHPTLSDSRVASQSQTVGLPIAKNSRGSGSLRISKGANHSSK